MSPSRTPFTGCRVVSACSALILICILIFHNHILSSIDDLRSSVASPKVPADSTPPEHNPQTPSSPHEFFSFVGQDPTGWAARLLPDNGGFIDTKYNDTFTLHVGISMFHALHCVEMVRGKIVDNDDEDMHAHHGPQNPLDDDPKERKFHLLHCLDYIIQVIMCGGDSTLEPPLLHFDVQGGIVAQEVNPEGNIHMCRDTDHLYNLVANSAKKPVPLYKPKSGDTVEKVYGVPDL